MGTTIVTKTFSGMKKIETGPFPMGLEVFKECKKNVLRAARQHLRIGSDKTDEATFGTKN